MLEAQKAKRLCKVSLSQCPASLSYMAGEAGSDFDANAIQKANTNAPSPYLQQTIMLPTEMSHHLSSVPGSQPETNFWDEGCSQDANIMSPVLAL
ncbi:hypothetical protein ACQKWADRAFT_306358 [Trichoderma austrokoningii]